MANVVIGKIELALSDVAHWLSGVQQVILKGPTIITALGSLLSELATVVASAETAVETPAVVLTATFQASTIAALKAVWPDVVAVFKAAGITI